MARSGLPIIAVRAVVLQMNRLSPSIRWHSGMLVTPTSQRHLSERIDGLVQTLPGRYQPYFWGVSGDVEYDMDALQHGTLAVRSIDAVMRNGCHVAADERAGVRLPLSLNDGQSVVVRLALGEDEAAGDASRFVPCGSDAAEIVLGEDGVEIPLSKPRLILSLDESPRSARPDASFPLCEVRRHGAAYRLTDFLPPTLQVTPGSALGRRCRTISQMLRTEASTVTDRVRLSAIVATLPAFEVMLAGNPHPFALYVELCRVAGAAAALRNDAIPSAFPPYDHDAARGGFETVVRYILKETGEKVSGSLERYTFESDGSRFHLRPDPGWTDALAPGSGSELVLTDRRRRRTGTAVGRELRHRHQQHCRCAPGATAPRLRSPARHARCRAAFGSEPAPLPDHPGCRFVEAWRGPPGHREPWRSRAVGTPLVRDWRGGNSVMRNNPNPGGDGGVSLFIQFRDFWKEVEAVKDALARGDIDAAAARNRLRDALKAPASSGARLSAPSVASDAQREAQYVMTAVADDVFVQIPSAAGRDWAMHPLELDLFGSRRAGQRVFERVDALLAGDSPNAGELAGIYLAALALGFKGMYADRADGEQKLAEYRDRSAHVSWRPRPRRPARPPVLRAHDGADAGRPSVRRPGVVVGRRSRRRRVADRLDAPLASAVRGRHHDGALGGRRDRDCRGRRDRHRRRARQALVVQRALVPRPGAERVRTDGAGRSAR